MEVTFMQKLPSNWKICATCSHWCGKQTPDVFCSYVEFDQNERAKCAGGGFNGAQMNGTASCNKLVQRFKK